MLEVRHFEMPPHVTGVHGEYVAGVRYKARAPWWALHPTIDVHTPPVFDAVHGYNRRLLGGCTYHLAHPGGRNDDTFPGNADEAETRRVARFRRHGQIQGDMAVHEPYIHPAHPYTPDPRRLSPRAD